MPRQLKEATTTPESSVAIREAIAELAPRERAAGDAIARLHGEREELLASGTDGELDAIESKINEAHRTRERLDAQLAILRGKLPAVEAAEQRAAHEEKLAQAKAAAARGRERLGRMATLARSLAEEAAALRDDEAIVRASWPASHLIGADKVKTPTQEKHAALNRVWRDPLDVAVIPSFAGDGRILFSKHETAITSEERKAG